MKLYNTLSRKLEEFEPIDRDNVRIYTCGPTVYKDIHIGNFRTYLTSDILRRILKFEEYGVTHVMNITDVGHMRVDASHGRSIDPIIEEASVHGRTPEEIAMYYSEQFLRDMKRLNISYPDVMPRATRHIPEMIEMIKVLLKKRLAYTREGNVYFDVRKFKDYGRLSGNTLDKMEDLLAAVRISTETDKRDSVDFALWKKATDGRAMKWDSPWGEGFPGWHIECSAMSGKYLGKHFDIHAGGMDLIFPHHEDEIGQSEGANGEKFVNYWVHTNYLTVEGEKMSRSKGNVILISDVRKSKFSPLAFRYLSYLTHYRAPMNFTWEGLAGAQQALDRLYMEASELGPRAGACEKYEEEFSDAISQDMNMPKAVAAVWKMMRSKKYSKAAKAASLERMDDVLGLDVFKVSQAMRDIPESILKIVRLREKMRKEKRYHLADGLRRKIEKRGYVLDDTDAGTKVVRKA